MMERRVHVPLGERAYDVVIGPGLLAQAGERIKPLLKRPQVAVLTDETVAEKHLEGLRAGLAAAGVEMTALALPPGEATKGWPQFTRAVEWLLEQKVERGDVVADPDVALGAGRQFGGRQDRHQRATG